MNITFKQLEVFKIVSQTENLTEAAQILFMTKGAVSQTITELERRLNRPLFDRYHKHIILNDEGRRMVPLVDELLTRAEDLTTIISENTPFALGASKTIASCFLPPILKRFQQKYRWIPTVNIANTEVLCNKLSSYQLDLALIEGLVHEPNIITIPWIEDEMVIIAANNYPTIPNPNLKWLEQQPWILREKASGSRRFFDLHIMPELDQPNIILELDDFDAILACVDQGLGISCVSKQLVSHHFFNQALRIIPFIKPLFRTLFICYYREKYLSKSANIWLEFINQYDG